MIVFNLKDLVFALADSYLNLRIHYTSRLRKMKHTKSLFLLSVIVIICLNGAVAERADIAKHLEFELDKHLKRLNKPAVKTIKMADGDIIDCVSIYRQPAFDHPLLKNHRIQMRPSGYPRRSRKKVLWPPEKEKHRRSGICPERTIPIRKTRREDLLRAESIESYGKIKPTTYSYNALTEANRHENALVLVRGGNYYGAKAEMNVWNIHVEPKEFSASKISILSSEAEDASSIQAGWLVHPLLFGDSKSRLFTYWTGDGFNTSGCYNMLCPGFIQVSQDVVLGADITPLSTYNGSQYQVELLIYKDPQNGNWWLVYGDKEPVGYWPTALFKNLKKSTLVEWGGEVLNTGNGGSHTITQMGNGHFPSEGYGKSSYFENILVVDQSNTFRPPQGLLPYSDKPHCYDVRYDGSKIGKDMGYFFLYGGPGIGPSCP